MKRDHQKKHNEKPDRLDAMEEYFGDIDLDEDEIGLYGDHGAEPNFRFFDFENSHVLITMDDDDEVIDVIVMSGEDDAAGDESAKIASMIDHTILKPDATVDQIVNLCKEARENHFASVCVNSCWVRLCAELLRGSDVAVCSVVGFPLGAMIPEAKAFETSCAAENGAKEIDMVINIGALKSRDY